MYKKQQTQPFTPLWGFQKHQHPNTPKFIKTQHLRIDLYKNQQTQHSQTKAYPRFKKTHTPKYPTSQNTNMSWAVTNFQFYTKTKRPNSQSKLTYVSKDSQNSCNKNSTHNLHSHNLFLPKILTFLDVINFRSPKNYCPWHGVINKHSWLTWLTITLWSTTSTMGNPWNIRNSWLALFYRKLQTSPNL
jgi:hypothetical protein